MRFRQPAYPCHPEIAQAAFAGGAVAAYGAGLTRTIMLSYSPALYAAGLTCIVAAVAIFLVKKPPQALPA